MGFRFKVKGLGFGFGSCARINITYHQRRVCGLPPSFSRLPPSFPRPFLFLPLPSSPPSPSLPFCLSPSPSLSTRACVLTSFMRRRCLSDKCARSCSCMCPRCRQLAVYMLPPGVPGKGGSRLRSRFAPRTPCAWWGQFCGQQGAGHRARTRWTTTVMPPPPIAREVAGAMRRAALHAKHVASSLQQAYRQLGCSLVRAAAATRGSDGTPSLQGRTSNYTRRMPAPLLACRACARARPPCPPPTSTCSVGAREREGQGADNGAGHAQQTQLRSRATGARSAPPDMGGAIDNHAPRRGGRHAAQL